MSKRIFLELEDEAVAELARLEAADDTEPEHYAASLLTQLVRGRALDGNTATELLRGMPGALDAAHEGSAQARRGEAASLDAI